MTNPELRAITGWSTNKLVRIAMSADWDDISYADARVYCLACGVTDQRRAKWLLRIAIERGGIATMQHLRNCHGNMLGVVRKYIKRATQILEERLNEQRAASHTTPGQHLQDTELRPDV
jgi:hypothetical protein